MARRVFRLEDVKPNNMLQIAVRKNESCCSSPKNKLEDVLRFLYRLLGRSRFINRRNPRDKLSCFHEFHITAREVFHGSFPEPFLNSLFSTYRHTVVSGESSAPEICRSFGRLELSDGLMGWSDECETAMGVRW